MLKDNAKIVSTLLKKVAKEEDKHIDYAFRWSHYYNSLEWAFTYFKGTDREPFFSVNDSYDHLIANYGQNEQIGLELQYNYEDWLFKSEVLKRDSELNGDYYATVSGFEYTFTNIKNKGIDIGVLYEYLFDERKDSARTGLHNSSFLGTRVALNDEKSTEEINFEPKNEPEISSDSGYDDDELNETSLTIGEPVNLKLDNEQDDTNQDINLGVEEINNDIINLGVEEISV